VTQTFLRAESIPMGGSPSQEWTYCEVVRELQILRIAIGGLSLHTDPIVRHQCTALLVEKYWRLRWRRTWTFYEDRYYDDTIRCYEIGSRIGVLERWKEQATDPAEIIKHSEQLGILLDMLQTVENGMIISNTHFQSIGGVNSASSNHRIIVRNTPYQPRPPATVQVPESTEHKPAGLQCNNELTGVVL
jgi:hypothetical protein